MELTVTDNAQESQFEGRDTDGNLVGHLAYRIAGDIYFLNHTVVEDAYQGQGAGSRIIAGSFGLIRAAGSSIVPRCPFVVAYLEKHPEDQPLVSNRM